MELNPILTRESRARWRGRSFGLLFAGVAIMALFMFFSYKDALITYDYSRVNGRYQSRLIEREASEVAASLFKMLTYYHVVAWMLLAPMLTATSISSERERGLLEGLQLSPLSPVSIVCGKLFSALSFVWLLFLAAMPILAICFLMGGVSPSEFAQGALQTFVAALLGASIGLCVSARTRRAAPAVGATFLFMVIWFFGTLLTLALAFWPTLGWVPILREVAVCIGLLNPVVTLMSWQGDGTGILPTFWSSTWDTWVIGCALQVVFSLLLLWLCVGPVRRPFVEQYWVEVGPMTDVLDLVAPQAGSEFKTGSETKTPDNEKPPPKAPPQSQSPRGYWELPITRHIKSENPILQRDLRAKFMFRRISPWLLIFQSFLLLIFAGIYGWLLWMVCTDASSREFIWPALAGSVEVAMIMAPAVIGAGAFTRERETGTWEGIRLSLLSRWEIISGKHFSAVIMMPLASLLLLPFLIPSLLGPTEEYMRRNITLTQVFLTFAVLFSTAWVCSAWGLRISWVCRKTATATSWAIGTLFVFLTILPGLIMWLLEMTYSYQDRQAMRELIDWLQVLHPMGAFLVIFEGTPQIEEVFRVLTGCGFLFMLGTLLLGLLHWQMWHQRARDT